MKIAQTQHKALSYTFTVTVPTADVADAVAKRLQTVAAQVKLSGFRPGKAPMNVIEQKYGQAAKAEIAEDFIQKAVQQTLEDNKLRSAGQPKVQVTQFADGKDLTFTIELEVLPQIKPLDFTQITVDKLIADVTPEEMDKALKRLADSRRVTEPSDEKRKTRKGDIIVIDFVGRENGKEFRGGTGKDYYLELGSNTFIPGFEEQLTGVDVPSKTLVKVSFPKTYHAPEMAGKDVEFDVDVKELRKPKKVELDADFAKSFGKDTLDELKDVISQELAKEYENVSKVHLRRAVLDALMKQASFEAPASMVDNEFNAIWKEFEAAKKKEQIDEDDKGKSDEELKKEYHAIAERRVKLGLILAEVANINKITLSKEDISGAVMKEARRYPGQEKAVIDFYTKNPQALEGLKAPLFEEKVMDFIIGKINLNKKKLSAQDLYAYDPDNKKKGK